MLIRMIILLTILMPMAHAKRIWPSSIAPSGKSFVFPYDPELSKGKNLFIYKGEKDYRLEALGVIDDCDTSVCKGRITKARKGSKITSEQMFLTHKYQEWEKKHYAYFSYGGPLIHGLGGGYLYDYSKEIRLGMRAGVMDHELGKIGVSGYFASLQGEMKGWGTKGSELNPYAEIGLLKATLDFAQFNGTENQVQAPFIGVGLNGKLIWDQYFLLGKMGYTHNFLKNSSPDSLGNIYTVTFAGGLLTLEFGLGMSF